MGRDFSVIVSTLPGSLDPGVAVAASRSGAIGVLDLEHVTLDARVLAAIDALVTRGRGRVGLKFDGSDPAASSTILAACRPQFFVIITQPDPASLEAVIRDLRQRGVTVLVEQTSSHATDLAEHSGADGVVAKGHEAGGWVGEETTFILLQRLIGRQRLPVWAHGGIGLHTAAACYAGGAAGVVLDGQLALSRESPLSNEARRILGRADGSETQCLGGELETTCRVFYRPGCRAVDELRNLAAQLNPHDPGDRNGWRREVRSRVGWDSTDRHVWLAGQDVAFAEPLARRFHTVNGIVAAVHDAVAAHVRAARTLCPLDAHAPLAQAHGTEFPIVQGPMTRVSDSAAFAAAVADGGALPFLALALMRAPEVNRLLDETRSSLGNRPWGVGILGFVPPDLREEQLDVVRAYKPRFALIAGGRPDQARVLEEQGIATYLHVPSPALLKIFLSNGARRFVFEGRECGGHVGPRSSFVLWNTMIEVLLESVSDLSGCHVLFAGGVHDALSGAMVAAMAAPLAARGARIGVLLGTAYLFTTEAVAAGAIVDAFQDEALHCTHTVLLATGPGHAIRCIDTPYREFFEREKSRLMAERGNGDEVREALEALNVGRLRIASKGLTRNPAHAGDPEAPRLIPVASAQQRSDGMYMIGQLAALRERLCSIASLHRDVAVESSARLARLEEPGPRPIAPPPRSASCDVAIIGMSCLLPKACDLQTYWENILNRVDAIDEVPDTRWDWRQYFDADPKAPDKIMSRWGGFLGDVPFDPIRYGMPPSSLRSIEPLQLLTLEAVRMAIDDAGYTERSLPRESTAVIIGAGGGIADLGQQYAVRAALPMFFGDSHPQVMARLPEWTEDSFPGLLVNVAAGRVANRFDLGGPNFTVDAACASSLAAVYLGIRELDAGTSDVVIVGGADTMQSPFAYLCFSKTQALSAHGRCRPFDASADGIAISEGLAVLVLKRLDDAERAGDRIYAVIKGVAGASDGRGKGLTAPRVEGQVRALERAYAAAGVSASAVQLLEAHGTGTVVGDQAEIEALRTVFEAAGAPRQMCAIGSVKSMIGHTKCAAGLAALIKVALALHHRILPPTIGVEQPNPKARFAESPFFVNTETTPWWSGDAVSRRRAGVSAFGFGGTNFHAVLEEYARDCDGSPEVETAPLKRWPAELFVFRGRSKADITSDVAAVQQALDQGARPLLRDLAYSLWQKAKERASADGLPLTLAIVAESLDDLQSKLTAFRERQTTGPGAAISDPRGIYYTEQPIHRQGKVAVIFPGQGSQYPHMLRDLFILFPELRGHVDAADRALAGHFDRPLSGFIFPRPWFTDAEEKETRRNLTRTEVAQPALATVEMAAYRLIESLGVSADVVAGHSLGEYVALCVAGVLNEETLVRLAEVRARLMLEAAGSAPGRMAAVDADEETTSRALRGLDDVWLANLNSPRQTIVSGTDAGVGHAVEILQSKGLRATPVAVACAFHSPLVAGAREGLGNVLRRAELAPPRIPVFSNTLAAPYPTTAEAIVALLCEQLTTRVDFRGEIDAMYAAGVRVFVEAGPRAILSGLVDQTLGDRPHVTAAIDAAGGRGPMPLQRALARLLAEGVDLRLDRLFAGRDVRRLALETLVEETQERPLDARFWLVNGGRARPASEPATPWEAPRSIAPSAASQTRPVPSGQPLGPQVSPVSPAAEVMLQFQRLMDRFLETQKRVMLGYLRSAGEIATPSPDTRIMAVQRDPKDAIMPAPVTPPPIGEEAACGPAQPASHPAAFAEKLLDIAHERTGYPLEMLDLDANIEADLGIDSIKRVEILATFQKACFPVERAGGRGLLDTMTSAKTLRHILAAVMSPSDALLPPTEETPSDAPPAQLPAPSEHDTESVPRLRFILRETPGTAERLQADGTFLVTDDETGVADLVASALRAAGSDVVLVRMRPSASESHDHVDANLADPRAVAELVRRVRRRAGAIAGVIHLLPLKPMVQLLDADLTTCQTRIAADVKTLFHLAKEVHGDLTRGARGTRGWLLAATASPGSSKSGSPGFNPATGAVAGLVKTLAIELPDTRCRAIEVEARSSREEVAKQVLSELQYSDMEPFVCYHSGRRVSPRPEAASIERSVDGAPIDAGSVVFITGGARGITAEVCCEMAERYRPTLVVVGRSPAPEAQEAAATADLTSKHAIKAALIQDLGGKGETPTPVQVEAAYTRLLRAREIRANLERMRQAGAKVTYRQADVRDPDAFASVIRDVYRLYGRIDGVVHGAGIIEDKLFQDKAAASFDRVFDTKVVSALVLARELRPDTLKFLVFFSSVAGAFGSRGQCDYTAANGFINSLAGELDGRWPGRIVAIDWGPWRATGMVSPEVQQQFIDRGVGLVPPTAGRRAFDDELRFGRKGESEVVLGWGPAGICRVAEPPASSATIEVSVR